MPVFAKATDNPVSISFDFYGTCFNSAIPADMSIDLKTALTDASVQQFIHQLEEADDQALTKQLTAFRASEKLDDWLFYQLIRKTAQSISPKNVNYQRYTLYKWYLLAHCGYDAILTLAGQKLLFYVQCDEPVYNIPSRTQNNKQYVCLNYHDYKGIDLDKDKFQWVNLPVANGRGFSYKINQLPDFPDSDYEEKTVQFNFYQSNYDFRIKMNREVKTIFANYPVVDYNSYFNIPLSKETYQSLIPSLKKAVHRLNEKNGIDFLMRFTRYAFLFAPDTEQFGDEKRLSPEQTLLYGQSDCDDRAGLFFYLVKEIYNRPMIVLVYPDHVTIGVAFSKPIGKTVKYNNHQYTICEPTPQSQDLKMGKVSRDLKDVPYEIAYAYEPEKQ